MPYIILQVWKWGSQYVPAVHPTFVVGCGWLSGNIVGIRHILVGGIAFGMSNEVALYLAVWIVLRI